jgi:chemotaxis protein CheC
MTAVEKQAQTKQKIDLFKALGQTGVDNIARVISRRMGKAVKVGNINAGMLRVSTLAEATAGPDNAALGVCVKVAGDCPGCGVFLLPYHHALSLADALMGSPIGSRKRFDELSTAILQEVARLIVSAQLSAFQQVCGIEVRNEGVTMAVDMAYKIVSSVVSSAKETDDTAMVVAMLFEQSDWKLEATFAFIPEKGVIDRLLPLPGSKAQLP